MERNEKEYQSPHPETAKVIPAREAATYAGEGKAQEVRDIKVNGDLH